jgi:hypothetical protein
VYARPLVGKHQQPEPGAEQSTLLSRLDWVDLSAHIACERRDDERSRAEDGRSTPATDPASARKAVSSVDPITSRAAR